MSEAANTSQRPKVCALIVTFEPQEPFRDCVDAIRSQVDLVIIVDNASSSRPARQLIEGIGKDPSIKLIGQVENIGVAAGLNRGFKAALETGFEYLVALDQDSMPSSTLVGSLLGALRDHPQPTQVAMVSPRIVELGLDREATYLRKRWGPIFEMVNCSRAMIRDVTITMTAGTLFGLSAYEELGPFKEELFIDFVDTEYCLRAKMANYETIVACEARLGHRWGERAEHSLGPIRVRSTHHSPERWYYISRNRIATIMAYGLHFPHWLAFDLINMVWWLVRMLLLEDSKVEKLKALIVGIKDGFLGRVGKRTPLRGERTELR